MYRYVFLILILLFFWNYSSAQNGRGVDSLENILKGKIPDTTRINTLIILAKTGIKSRNFQESMNYLDRAATVARENNIETPYNYHWIKADLLHYMRDNNAAIEEMRKTLERIKKLDNVELLGKAKNSMAWFHLYAGKFSESINLFEENIEFAKANQLKSILPEAYSGLSYVFRDVKNTEEQRKNLILMIDAARQLDDKYMMANGYLRLGDIGMEVDSNFTYAIQQYHKCLNIHQVRQDSAAISFALLRIGWNHYLNHQLDTALNYFFHSLEYSIPINRLTSITNAYGNIGTIYRDKNEPEKAEKYYKKSIEYSHKAKDWYNLSWLYDDMSAMFKNMGDYKKAYEYFVLHKQFSDSLEMSKYSASLSNARMRYETEKKEQELEFLNLKLKQHSYFNYGFAGLIILTVVISLLIFRQSRMNAKRKISEMNHKISEITQKNLRQQMNPHFIFNTLNSIQYYMYQHDKISTNNYLTKFSSLIRKTLENSQHTSIPIKDEIDALELYLQLESIRFKEKFDYQINIDEDIDTLIYKIPTMLIQPYVENAICHGLINKDEKGYVHVNIKLGGDRLACTIEDNGIGRDAAMEIKKHKNGNHNSLGTKITESRLNLVNALYGKNMKIDYTDLKDQEGKPAGTRVTIHIPIMT
jgi:tetratricopeptide (TPR) repeat protein